MAFDELQLPAVVINNDRLISMAGNLMAKKKAEEVATQKALTDEIAKLDASKIRYPDVDTWNVKYENLLNAGTNASKNPTDVKSQIQYKTALNEAKSWLVGNNQVKEQFDIPNVKVAYDPDYNEGDRSEAQKRLTFKQEDLLNKDQRLYNKIDKEDYLLKIANEFSPTIFSKDDKFRYKNDLSRSGAELRAASDVHALSRIKTETGQKALAEVARLFGADLTTKSGQDVAINQYKNAVWELSKPNLKGDVENLPEDNSLNIGIGGWDKKKEGLFAARAEEQFNLRKRNPEAIQRLKNKLGPGSTVKFAGDNMVINYNYKEKQADGTEITKTQPFLIPLNKGMMAFHLGFNPVYDAVSNMGSKDITNEEMLTYLNDSANKRWRTTPNFKGTTSTKAVAKPVNNPTNKTTKAASKGSTPPPLFNGLNFVQPATTP
jgi:hypothetical protein